MAIGDREFQQVMQAQDEGTLGSILNFSRTGSQDASNERLRALINQRLAEVRAQQEQKKMQEQLTAQAKDYRANLKGTQERQFASVADPMRQQLAQQMSGIRGQANKRGLLYSGQRAGAESQAQGQAAQQLSGQRAQINEATQNVANTMEQQAVQSGLQTAQQRQKEINDAYNQALKQKQGESAVTGALGGAIGQGLGSYLGGRR